MSKSKNGSFGLVYCYNDSLPYRKMCELSVRSVRRWHPDVPISIKQLPTASSALDAIRWRFGSRVEGVLRSLARRMPGSRESDLPTRFHSFAEKLAIFAKPPFDWTVFVDCDTFLMRPLNPLRELAESGGVDVVAQEATGRQYEPCPPLNDKAVPVTNCGVFLFNQNFADRMSFLVERHVGELAHIYEPDQRVFSAALDALSHERKRLLPDLQVANEPKERDKANATNTADYVRHTLRQSPLPATWFHYIFQKRAYYNALKRMT